MTRRIILPQHEARVKECQALFSECLKRYKADRGDRTDQQIVNHALKTLVQNGFTKVEIERAMQ
jgi:hypothetical protein